MRKIFYILLIVVLSSCSNNPKYGLAFDVDTTGIDEIFPIADGCVTDVVLWLPQEVATVKPEPVKKDSTRKIVRPDTTKAIKITVDSTIKSEPLKDSFFLPVRKKKLLVLNDTVRTIYSVDSL